MLAGMRCDGTCPLKRCLGNPDGCLLLGQVAARALQLAEVLMQKLPDVFLTYFAKEGVVHAIDQLAAAAPPSLPVLKEPKRKGRRQSPRAKVGLPCIVVLLMLAAQAAGFSIAHQICQPLRPYNWFRSWCFRHVWPSRNKGSFTILPL